MAELFKLVGTIAIDATDATNKIEGVITAGADLESKLNGIGANADSSIGSKSGFGAASVWLGNVLTELTKRAANLGKEFVLSGLKYNAAMEGYEVSFATLLNGDIEKAKKLMDDITDFALDSPLNVSGVSAAALQLLNIGTAYEDVMPMLEMLGNLALGDASKMDRLSVALAQVMGFGQLYGQEKQQFVNAGVPLYQLLEDYYKIVEGMDEAGLDLDAMQRGGNILSEHVLGALQLATMSDEEILAKYGFSGERAVSFYNAMSAMLPTYTGQMQKASEQTEMAAGSVVKPYQEGLTDKVLPAYTELMAAITEKYKGDETNENTASFLSEFASGAINAITDAISGKYDLNAENQDLTSFGKLVTGVYDFDEFIRVLRTKEIDPDADNGGGGKYFGDPQPGSGVTFTDGEGNELFLQPLGNALDGVGGSNGSMSTISALLQQLSTLKTDVAAAAKEGVVEGVSGITINGYVTTGDVRLNEDTIVGTLAPMFNMELGQIESQDGWG